MSNLEEEFMVLEAEISQRLEKYRELCERMGFDFRDHVQDIIEESESRY